MIINSTNLYRALQDDLRRCFQRCTRLLFQVAMMVPSSSRDETHGWLGQFPQMREWLTGDREVKDLEAFKYTITNRKFESTVGIKREDFSDDRLGVFKPMFSEMGHLARQHPDEWVFPLLASGFATLCFDGQNFLDTDHPTKNAAGTLTMASNMQAGTDPGWYLLSHRARCVR